MARRSTSPTNTIPRPTAGARCPGCRARAARPPRSALRQGARHRRAPRDGVTTATHEAFDPASAQWTTLAPLPKARDHIGLIVVAGKITPSAAGLLSTNTNQPLHDVYDPATNAWTAAAPMPTPRSSIGVTEYRGLIVVVGGEGDATGPGSAFKDNEGYDLKTGQWVRLASPPLGRHGLGAATVGANAYFAGGPTTRGGAGATAELLAFTLP